MTEKMHKQRIGKWGEEIAVRFLEGKGLSLVARNVHTEYGEIDLIMLDHMDLVFIEVKTRTTASFGMPEDAISSVKREHMIHSAEAYLQTHIALPDTWRIDVIAIRGKPSSTDPEITWFQNAVV
jgi:putative endonuclease